MFNFFRKKKNENKEEIETTPSSSLNKPTLQGGALEAQYKELLQKHKKESSALTNKANLYIQKYNYKDRNEWIDALSICDAALECGSADNTIKELYRQIFSIGWNKYVSINYNEADYDFWFYKCVEINNRFANAGVTRAYCEQADTYGSARRGYRDLDKKMEYMNKGVEKDDPASIGDYGYGIYWGQPGYGKTDKQKGREYINRSAKLGYEYAEMLDLYVSFFENDGSESPELVKKISDCIEKTQPAYYKPYHLLADHYLRLRVNVDQSLSPEESNAEIQRLLKTNLDKAVELMKKGVEADCSYSKYLLGMNMLNGRIENADKAEALELLKSSYDHNVVPAANFLGSYYLYNNDENSSIDIAITWFEKAALYCFPDSSFELACLYLHNDKYKDTNKGLTYLQQAIEDGSHRALSEKAYLILETDILPHDVAEAKDLLEKALDMGNDYAPYRLGLAYQNAEFGGEPDYEKALQLFELGAERNNIYSMELAGNYYRVGVGGDNNEAYTKAVHYLQRAKELGSNYAHIELSLCYEMGMGVEKDSQKAFELLKEAADNNYPYANFRMASYFEEGVFGEPDFTEAFRQYEIAAEAGIPDAIYNKGRYYKYAIGLPENPSEAMRLFDQAAQANSAPALVEMALAYETEYAGRTFDADKTLEYMTKAAEMGYTYAQYKVGTYYYYGLVEADIEKAFEWFTRAYQQGGYPYAATMLGDIYLYNARGAEEPEYDKAIEYYKSAEEKGVISDGLGVCYDYGLGVEENETTAFKYYTLAANDGYTAAKYRLGLAYKYGRGTAINLTEAYQWLSDAAQNGNYNAQYETAMMLFNGEGVGMDEDRGIEILKKVAEEGHDKAQFELANCYLSGRGVAEDEVQAMFWYQKAAENGNEQAQKITGKRERRKR